MIKYFQKAFKVTNENIILTTPLVLFLFFLSIYLGVAQRAPENIYSAVLLLATILLMISAFFAGWFFMVKKAIDLSKREFIIDEDKTKASFGLLREVPVGIGEYFLSFIGALFLYAGLFFLLFFIGFQIGIHFIGKVDLNLNELRVAFGSPVAMKSLVSSLTHEQLARLNAWNLLFLVVTAFYSFITMFWPAQIIFKTKNPFVAFFKSAAFTFKNFFGAFILFVYISCINFVVSFANAFAVANPIVYFLSMLIYFYFVVYVVVVVFLYYDGEDQSKFEYYISGTPEPIGKGDSAENNSAEDNCDSGADSIGQDEPGNQDSKDE